MGAVTAIMYGDKDPQITSLVLDSAFSSLKTLVEEIVKRQIKVADFVIQAAIGIVSDSVKERAKFEIKNLETIFYAKRCFMPALFCCAEGDDFVEPHHTKELYDVYPGEKSFLEVDGDHNSTRPKKLKDTVASFFYTTLQADNLENLSNKFSEAQIQNEKDDYMFSQLNQTRSNLKSAQQSQLTKQKEIKDHEKIVSSQKPLKIEINHTNDKYNNNEMNIGLRMQQIRDCIKKSSNQSSNQPLNDQNNVLTNKQSNNRAYSPSNNKFNNNFINLDSCSQSNNNKPTSNKNNRFENNNSINKASVNNSYSMNVFHHNKNIINKIYGIENEMNEDEIFNKILDYFRRDSQNRMSQI